MPIKALLSYIVCCQNLNNCLTLVAGNYEGGDPVRARPKGDGLEAVDCSQTLQRCQGIEFCIECLCQAMA